MIPVLCVCCYKRAVKGENHHAYLIHSWEEPEPEARVVATEEGEEEEAGYNGEKGLEEKVMME